MLIEELVKSHQFQKLIKEKAHTWLPAYFSRYELTPEEQLLISKKGALESALQSQDLAKVDEVLDLFPELLNQPLNNGEVAINYAVKNNLNNVIAALLARGADPKTKDRFGLNAIDIALQKQDKALFAQLITIASTLEEPQEFVRALDSTVVTGISAKLCLDKLQLDLQATRNMLTTLKFESEKNKSYLSSLSDTKEEKKALKDKKDFFATILKGDFVKFKQTATLEKLKEVEEEVGAEIFFQAAILSGSLILDQILKMGFEFPKHEGESTTHPLRFAFCSKDPIEAFVPFFDKLGFDVHSLASLHKDAGRISYFSPECDEVSYFELLVYQKLKNAQEMDPIAVTGWDIAFATFSLCSFFINYHSQYVPQSLIPFLRLGLNCANYSQAISLLVFKLSYTREGKVNAALSQLMTHYMVSQFFPVRIYYAGMTLYSAMKTCYDHRYRSFADLSKKLIVQIPAATEFIYYTYTAVVPKIQKLYDDYFGPTKQKHYNFNEPSPPPKKPTPGSKGADSDSSVQVFKPENEPMLENTPFMEKFGNNSAQAMLYNPNARSDSATSTDQHTALGTIFNGKDWIYDDSNGHSPKSVESFSAALEFGKDFHKNTPWYQHIKGTPLENTYRNTHLQAAATASVRNYRDGFSVQGAFRIDLKGKSALEHFVRTVIEGGAMHELVNADDKALASSQGTYVQGVVDVVDCFITSRDQACKNAQLVGNKLGEFVYESIGSSNSQKRIGAT